MLTVFVHIDSGGKAANVAYMCFVFNKVLSKSFTADGRSKRHLEINFRAIRTEWKKCGGLFKKLPRGVQ